MAKKGDITTDKGQYAMTFHCRACKKDFAKMSTQEVFQRNINRTLDQETDRITADHVESCKGV